MGSGELAGPDLAQGKDVHFIDIKEALVQAQPIPTDLTPASTPEEKISSNIIDAMTGKKIFGSEKPDDRARELAAKLTLEEQVNIFSLLNPYDRKHLADVLYPSHQPNLHSQ